MQTAREVGAIGPVHADNGAVIAGQVYAAEDGDVRTSVNVWPEQSVRQACEHAIFEKDSSALVLQVR